MFAPFTPLSGPRFRLCWPSPFMFRRRPGTCTGHAWETKTSMWLKRTARSWAVVSFLIWDSIGGGARCPWVASAGWVSRRMCAGRAWPGP